MSTDPALTPGVVEAPDAPDTPANAPIDLVEKGSSPRLVEDDAKLGLEATPAPSPPPLGDPPISPLDTTAEHATEEPGSAADDSATNLAYEDMLAKLAVATQAPLPEAETPTVETAPSLLESAADQTPISPTPSMTPSSPSMLATPLVRRVNPVTPQELLSEDDDTTVPGRRAAVPAQPVVRGTHLAHPEPFVSVQGSARSRLIHLALGGGLVVGGMFLAVVVLRLLMPGPVAQPPATTAPSTPPPPPAYAPPIQIEPLPPGTASAEMPALPADSAADATAREGLGLGPQRSPRKAGLRPKSTRSSAPFGAGAEASAAAELTTAPKAPSAAAAPAKEATSSSGRKSGSKAGAYVDPFE